MRTIALLVIVVACGGSKKPVADETPPVAATPKPVERQEPEDPTFDNGPEAPKTTGAKAALAPLKGAKQPPGTVTFAQGDEASTTNITSDFEGLRPGTYHLVIHDGSECGDNGDKAGGPWKGAEGISLKFKVGRDQAGNLDESGVKLMLSGVAPIVGQTIMLHEDKKGQPGKAIACGTIDAVGS
jgi:Cu/Zn superoxide dismutase